MCDWKKAQQEYVTGSVSYQDIAEKYGVSKWAVGQRGHREQWTKKRSAYQEELSRKTTQKLAEKNADAQADLMAIQADSAIRIAQAINEYLTDGSHWKPFDLLRIANTWQILQDNLLKQKDMQDADDQLPKYVALLPERTEIDDVEAST